jgi:hypothetical protein
MVFSKVMMMAVLPLALLLLPSPMCAYAQDEDASATPAVSGFCEYDPELKELAASNPDVAQCCNTFDTVLGDIQGVLAQGITALVPVLGCATQPPIDLSAQCYQDLLSSGANCYNEMNVMIDFFNSSGLLTTLTDAADGNVENITEAIPGQDEFEKMALNYLPTAQEQLQAITGSDQINPVCCQSVSTLIADKCACEEKPMSFVTKRLDKTGVQLSSFIGLAKTVMGNMGCDAAEQLQVYPDCVS